MVFQPIEILVRNQQTIQIVFSSPPSLFLTKSNFSISSTFSGVSDLEILSISIDEDTITLATRPQFSDNLYIIGLLDLPTQPFEDENNVELFNAVDSRRIYFVGVQDINTVRDTMLRNLPDNYNVDQQTIVYDVTSTMANEVNTASVTLREIKNDNFISIPVTDELYYRGGGPADRLANEGAYKISRVAKTLTGTNAAGTKTFDPIADPNVPFEIINLRVMQIEETIPNEETANKFDGFLLTVNKHYVTKLISVLLEPDDITYDPSKYGYALLNNSYDRLARPSAILENNQILLSALTNGAFPEPVPGNVLTVIYEFDNLGRRVDKSSVSLFTVQEQINERIPSSVTNFYLEFANVVGSSGETVTLNGVEFNISTINLQTHPAFLREIAFNIDSLPGEPGEYTVNYATGQVFVSGTQNQIGSGITPPVATYFYKNIATSNVDYFISDDGYNVSLNSFSQFAAQEFTITYLYEDVLTPDIDYVVSSHNEVLNERINNRLVDDFSVRVNNSPVKDIYQIKNETTGESYVPGLIEGNQIYFTGNAPPATKLSYGELAQLGVVSDEALAVGIPAETPNGLLDLFPIALGQHPVMNQRQDGIGANFDTSIQFTNTDIFVNEFYYNSFESIEINLGKLREIGDYLVDYANGNIYLAVSSTQDYDVGHISYTYGVIIPAHTHVLGVSSIGLGKTSTHLLQSFELGVAEDGLIIPEELNYGYDTFDGTTRAPNTDGIYIAQLQDDYTVYAAYPIKKVYGVYTQNDVDGYASSDLADKNLFSSAVNSFSNTVIDLKTYVVLPVEVDVPSLSYKVIIPDSTSTVKSIITVDTNIQILDLDLWIIKHKNIIANTSVDNFDSTATVTLQNIITLDTPTQDSFVDIAGYRYPIISISAGNVLTVAIPSGYSAPTANPGSQILDHNGILVANHLNLISVTKLPDLLYIVHYDVFPSGIHIGYQIKDSADNVFTITDVQTASVVVAVDSDIIPVIDPVSRIETQSMLQADTPTVGETTLILSWDAPIEEGTNLKIGYVPDVLNDLVLAANAEVNSTGGTGMVIDYSMGQYFIDYKHLDDEILVSYDWGDNQLDWSISDTLAEGNPYYVSYEYGASRDGLETNFAPLTNVDFLQTAPLSISRETYRTAVGAAIKAFLKGPTHEAIRLLVHAFTQIDPEIQEAILNKWIVGRDPLGLQNPVTTGSLTFGNGKYNEGLILTNDNSIQLPGESSLKLAQGTFSAWFRPNWNGAQADEEVTINLPSAPVSIYYNAHGILPQDAPADPWYLLIDSDAYGTAYVSSEYLEVRNSKNYYSSTGTPSSVSHFLIENDGYDAYAISSTLQLHDAFTSFPYMNQIGTYIWNRLEPTLNIANDIDITLYGYVNSLNYVNSAPNVIKVTNTVIDDGYMKYDAGFYLLKRNVYTTEIALEDVHLSIEPPFPHYSPPILVSTVMGSGTVTVTDGDTSTLSIGQQVTIGTAFPELTNILGFTDTTIVLRQAALTTLTDVAIEGLDPVSSPGTQDGYGETHLQDKLGTRPYGTTEVRSDGWERQLLVKLQLTLGASGHLMVIGSSDPPLTTQAPVVDFLETIVPGLDVFIDGYGNAFEVDSFEAPYVWLKKPAASLAPLPLGQVTAFRKVAGVCFPGDSLVSMPINWSSSASCTIRKRSGIVELETVEDSVSASYLAYCANNSDGISSISFGQIDENVDSTSRIQGVNYTMYSVFDLEDMYIGNTGSHPEEDVVSFKYDIATTGIPAISSEKYFAVFTSKQSAAEDEPVEQVYIKTKIPSTWTLSDETDSASFTVNPVLKFSIDTTGDLIHVVDGYGLTYRKIENNTLRLTAIDTSVYTPGNLTILQDEGPELRVSAGKRHFLFEAITPEGALRLYRSGSGFMTAETQLANSALYNIRADISDWQAGQLHHIAMSWKINSPDETDELHLFLDGDEVPNEVTFGSGVEDGYFGQVYEEELVVVSRVVSSDGDGYIGSNLLGGGENGLFITDTAIIQPDDTWIDKTIVLEAGGPDLYLQEPLIVGSIIAVTGGNLLLLSRDGEQIDFSYYGPSAPVLYGLATSATAETTILVRSNFGVFQNGEELNGPSSTFPQFRQAGNTQVVELYNINEETGKYEENVSESDTITIQTYGLLTQRIKTRIYQYGGLDATDKPIASEVAINDSVLAFITDLPPPVDPTQIEVTKILLPRVMI